ncbi:MULTISPECIES: hypothetical protein [Henriciella]|jgi:hypothetical protein|uniref:Uncharacterized protein n=1 Tax=Henriciella pelagia TaxID=1977912 RepID=A0ABQ1JUS0_9PROT|nr:hypothetical protein [Henriciella pelagia]GGB78365.1 hypothetical protein GCM10011503_28980 [Henriciella pelagia]
MKRLDLLRAIHGKPQSVRERLGLKTRRKRKSRGARLLKLLTN